MNVGVFKDSAIAHWFRRSPIKPEGTYLGGPISLMNWSKEENVKVYGGEAKDNAIFLCTTSPLRPGDLFEWTYGVPGDTCPDFGSWPLSVRNDIWKREKRGGGGASM